MLTSFLQKARFGEGIVFTQKLDKETFQTLVPPFTLQLLVENCIKHNIVSQSKPLHITIYNTGHHLVIENAVQRKLGRRFPWVGLDNIKMRYKHLLEQDIIIHSDEKRFR